MDALKVVQIQLALEGRQLAMSEISRKDLIAESRGVVDSEAFSVLIPTNHPSIFTTQQLVKLVGK